jgi:hypothetical protein
MSEPAHVLAEELAERLDGSRPTRVLLIGAGSGRNRAPFERRGIVVDAVESADLSRAIGGQYDAAITTSGLLHVSWPELRSAIEFVAGHLPVGAYFFATLGSQRDPRFGLGERVDERTWTPESGSEAGVPHVYVARPDLATLFDDFDIIDSEERSAAETVGRWAHAQSEAATIVHWFVRARRRA